MAAAVKDKGYRVLLKVGSGRELNNVQDSVKDRRRAGVASYPESFSVEEIAALVSLVEPEVIMFGGDEVAGYPHEIAKMASSWRLLVSASACRNLPVSWEKRAGAVSTLHVVRIHTIYPKELSRYDVDSGAARFLRAVKERSYRLLYVRFWPDDPETGARLIEELGTSLAALGYARGAAPTLPPWQSHWVYLVTALAAWAGAGLWLGLVLERSLGSWWKLLYRLAAAAAVLGVLALYFFFDQILARQALAFLTAVTFPVLAVIPQRWQTRGLQQGAASRGETVFCRAMSDHRISRGKPWDGACCSSLGLSGSSPSVQR